MQNDAPPELEKGLWVGRGTGSMRLASNCLLVMAARIFHLTDWVYKVITEAVPTTKTKPFEVVRTYNKCLSWYSSLMGNPKCQRG